VLGDGQVLQSGARREVFSHPASRQVGRLLGIDNLFDAIVGADNWNATLARSPAAPAIPQGTSVLWQVPPEAVGVVPGGADGSITDVIDLGRSVEVLLTLAGGQQLRARLLDASQLAIGDSCRVDVPPDAITIWPAPVGDEPA